MTTWKEHVARAGADGRVEETTLVGCTLEPWEWNLVVGALRSLELSARAKKAWGIAGDCARLQERLGPLTHRVSIPMTQPRDDG